MSVPLCNKEVAPTVLSVFCSDLCTAPPDTSICDMGRDPPGRVPVMQRQLSQSCFALSVSGLLTPELDLRTVELCGSSTLPGTW